MISPEDFDSPPVIIQSVVRTLRKRQREVGFTQIKRHFNSVCASIHNALADESSDDILDDVSTLVSTALDLLLQIRTFVPIIPSSNLGRYQELVGHFREWIDDPPIRYSDQRVNALKNATSVVGGTSSHANPSLSGPHSDPIGSSTPLIPRPSREDVSEGERPMAVEHRRNSEDPVQRLQSTVDHVISELRYDPMQRLQTTVDNVISELRQLHVSVIPPGGNSRGMTGSPRSRNPGGPRRGTVRNPNLHPGFQHQEFSSAHFDPTRSFYPGGTDHDTNNVGTPSIRRNETGTQYSSSRLAGNQSQYSSQDTSYQNNFATSNAGLWTLPERWQLPSPDQMAARFRERNFDKLWKFAAHLIAVFSGETHDYHRWASTFYDTVHIQPLPMALKFSLLEQKLAPSVKDVVLHGLNHSPNEYVIALHRLEKYYGGNERWAQSALYDLEHIDPVRSGDWKSARQLLNLVESYLRSEPEDLRPHSRQNTMLIQLLKQKVPAEWFQLYRHWLSERNWKLIPSTFLAWAIPYVDSFYVDQNVRKPKRRACVTFENTEDGADSSQTTTPQLASYTSHSSPSLSHNDSCPKCGISGHPLKRCEDFYYMNPADRKQFVLANRRCLVCLGQSHTADTCYSTAKCPVCFGKHHPLLHTRRETTGGSSDDRTRVHVGGAEGFTSAGDRVEIQPSSSTQSPDTRFVGYCNMENALVRSNHVSDVHMAKRRSVALAFSIVSLKNPVTRQVLLFNALLNTGANSTSVSKKVGELLMLDGVKETYTLEVSGGDVKQYTTKMCSVLLGDRSGSFWTPAVVRVLPHPCVSLRAPDWNLSKHWFPHLKYLLFHSPVNRGNVDIIIGTDYAELMRAITPDRLGPDPWMPILRDTPLGWVPFGVIDPSQDNKLSFSTVCHSSFMQYLRKEEPDMEQPIANGADLMANKMERAQSVRTQMEHVFDVADNLRFSSPIRRLTGGEVSVVDTFYEHFKIHNGHAYSPLLWKTDVRPSGNYYEAMRFFLRTELLVRPPEVNRKIHEIITNWGKQSIIEKITSQCMIRDPSAYYIPSFVVSRQERESTKYRLVFNAARPFHGKALNDYLVAGPNNLCDIGRVLLQFRLRAYTYTCDVQQMYMFIRVAQQDRKYLRFFHRNPDSEQVEVYQSKGHLFGLCSSPFVAIETVKSTARNCQKSKALVKTAFDNHSIVDDILISVDDCNELRDLHLGIFELLKQIGMTVHKVSSNHRGFMKSIPSHIAAEEVTIRSQEGHEDISVIKTLGMMYIPSKDAFTFNLKYASQSRWTTRTMLSVAAQIYDPLGLLSPVIIGAKLLVQTAWKGAQHWDSPTPGPLTRRWDGWLASLSSLNHLEVPRMVAPVVDQLHIFSDASTFAYGMCAYAVAFKNQVTTSRLLMSKSRVAPTRKSESVARMELAAAQLAAKVGSQLTTLLSLTKAQVFYWTDSSTVLWWLHSTRDLSVYVANRICTILDHTSPSQWRFVPTERNPADYPSRGVATSKLQDLTLWWHGPDFISSQEVHWPHQESCTPTPGALQEVVTLDNYVKRFGFLHKQVESSLYTFLAPMKPACIVSTIKAIHRVICVWCKCAPRNNLLNEFIKGIQTECLTELRNGVINRHKLPKHYVKLNPFLDARGILRVGGRLSEFKHHTYDERCPIILPKGSPFVAQIILHIHSQQLRHIGGPLHLANAVQARYWIFGGRHELSRILRLCVRCQARHPQPVHAQMAPLSRMRIPINLVDSSLRPFINVGLDMAGPWLTKKGKETRYRKIPDQKRYLIIFVCGYTRAMHLEMVYSANTDSFLCAFDRFVATRGWPTRVQSDNGGNFISGERQLRELMSRWINDGRNRKPELTWVFNTPYSPHQGGNYERMIRSVKEAFYNILPTPQTKLTDEELHTAFKHIESVLNTRPLTLVSFDPRDPKALCPLDFIIGRQHVGFPPHGTFPSSLATRWRHLQNLTSQIWKEFAVRYIRHLHLRNKWPTKETPLVVGQIVVVMQPTVPKGSWPLGIIQEVIVGKDGQVRNVTVRTAHGLVTRNCTAIAPLAQVEQANMPVTPGQYLPDSSEEFRCQYPIS